jgi:hypothetical protein
MNRIVNRRAGAQIPNFDPPEVDHSSGRYGPSALAKGAGSPVSNLAVRQQGGPSRRLHAILPPVYAKGLTPILNVSDIVASFLWFEEWGWQKCWDWGTPPTFGAVISGKCEIFLCQGAQGGRGKGTNLTTFQDDEAGADKGVWMSVWVEDVDAVHQICVAARLDVTMPPTDEPWHVREMHLRHPDGHVFRISKGLEST